MENEIQPMTFIGWFNNPQYAIKTKSGTAQNGREWNMTSISLSINFSTFQRAIGAQLQRLMPKQQVTIIGKPKITQKDGKTYMNVEIVSVHGNMGAAPLPTHDLEGDPLKQPPIQQQLGTPGGFGDGTGSKPSDIPEMPPDAPVTDPDPYL